MGTGLEWPVLIILVQEPSKRADPLCGKNTCAYLPKNLTLCQGIHEVACLGQDSFVVTCDRASAQMGIYQKAVARCMVLSRFEEAVALGMAGPRSPRGAVRSRLFLILAMLSELLAFPGRVSPWDCNHVHQPCGLPSYQLNPT